MQMKPRRNLRTQVINAGISALAGCRIWIEVDYTEERSFESSFHNHFTMPHSHMLGDQGVQCQHKGT
jgi:hypothetical protein